MARGAGAVSSAEAWRAADRYESFIRPRLPRGYEIHTLVSDRGGKPEGQWVAVTLHLPDKTYVCFDWEAIEVFPSDYLKAQIMLVIG
jgi:hypothetical protein